MGELTLLLSLLMNEVSKSGMNDVNVAGLGDGD